MLLKEIEEVPDPYKSVFSNYPCFNAVQSEVFDHVLHSDKSLVISAPTGSGKSTIFELAIIKLLMEFQQRMVDEQFKIIYICPIKSLCQEKLVDWHQKFSPFGINCISVTGDSDKMDFQSLASHNLILSTPEKWDSLTRRWKDNTQIIKVIKLFMIDEVHLLNEENRGSTLEVIVSRMKTIQNSYSSLEGKIRFVAVSATIQNIEDIADWIEKPGNTVIFKFPEEMRPVPLKKIVLGFSAPQNQSPFKFDLSLNYKLQSLIRQYSEGKPTLIFCSTRKSVEMTALHLVQNLQIRFNVLQCEKLNKIVNLINDTKVRETIKHGVGYHHAGLSTEVRRIIEDTFRQCHLPILVTTSTLAMGVNLPAHLIIIKSTKCYDNGGFRDYTEIAIQQMIGRAGRPQFDTTATALILTTNNDKGKFERMVGCTQPIESNLHRHLTEHLNAEVVLRTITDLNVAMQWLSSTFLYVRARKNPLHYGLHMGLSKDQIDKKLLEMCQIDLNKLVKVGMLVIDQDALIIPTKIGEIMAKYYMAYETIKLFTQLSGTEILLQILELVSKCREFFEMRLRTNDKKCLNLLNRNSKKDTVRFPLKGKIKTLEMKVNCIIQAVMGNLEIHDHSLLTESWMIIKNGERITKCLIEYLTSRGSNCYSALLNSIILCKCFHTKLWENSPFVSKQLSGIGNVLSRQLVNAGKTSFDKILESNPRDLEVIIKKRGPIGDMMIEEVRHIPRYKMAIENISSNSNEWFEVQISIILINTTDLLKKSTINLRSAMILVVGDHSNEVLLYERYQHSYLVNNPNLTKFVKTKIGMNENVEIEAHFISEDWVGIDVMAKLTNEIQPMKLKPEPIKSMKQNKLENEKQKYPTYMQMYLDLYAKIKKNNKTKKSEVTDPKVKEVKDESFEKNKMQVDKKKIASIKKEMKSMISNQSKKHKNTVQFEDKMKDDTKEILSNAKCLKRTDSFELKVSQDLNTSKNNLLENRTIQSASSLQNVFKLQNGSDSEINHPILSENSAAINSEDLFDTDESTLIVHNNNYCSTSKDNKEALENSNSKANLGVADILDQSFKIHAEENQEKCEESYTDCDDFLTKDPLLYDISQKYLSDLSTIDQNFQKNSTTVEPKRGPKRKFDELTMDFEDQLHRQKEEPKSKNIFEHFKMEPKKKISHQSEVHSQINTSRFCITEIREPPTRNFLDEMQDEQNPEYQQKSIKWSSPLIYSPPVKFSPKFQFQITPKHRTDNGNYAESCETMSSNTNTLTLNIQKTPKEIKVDRNPLTKQHLKDCGTKFLLLDNAYKGNRTDDSNETLQTKGGEQRNKYSDLDKASNAMEYYTQQEKQNDRQVSKSLNTSVDKENMLISDTGSSVSRRPANNTSANVLSPVVQRNSGHLDLKDFILAQNKTISQSLMRNMPRPPPEYIDPRMANYYDSDMERNLHFKHLNRSLDYIAKNEYDAMLPTRPNRSDYYGNNPVMVSNMTRFYPTHYPSTDYSVPSHLNLNHSMSFPQYSEDFQYSHRPVPYHRFDLDHSDQKKETLGTWYYPQMDPTYKKHVFGEQKYCQKSNVTYSQPLRANKNEISLQNNNLISNPQNIIKPSQDVRKVFRSQDEIFSSNYDEYCNDLLQYGQNFDSKVRMKPVQSTPSIEATRTALPPEYVYRTNPDLNRSISSRYQVPPNVGHYELPNYPRPLTHLDAMHLRENVRPCYGIPRECQYFHCSPNDKEYVMNKFFYSLNEDH